MSTSVVNIISDSLKLPYRRQVIKTAAGRTPNTNYLLDMPQGLLLLSFRVNGDEEPSIALLVNPPATRSDEVPDW